MNRGLLSAAVAAAVVSLMPIAFAQTASDAPTVTAQATQPRAQDRANTPNQAQGRRAFATPSERVEARLAYARTALKITEAQQPQWDNFANVLRKQARAMDQRFQERRARFESRGGAPGEGMQRRDARTVSAIERLELRQQRMAERATRLSEVIAAAKPLYATFSPEQRQVADGMLARGGHGRGGAHQHHRGMHRGPSA
jgi:hypothetical protein